MTVQTGTLPPTQPKQVWVKRLLDAVIDYLFPPHCAICGRFGAWLCDRCLERVDTFEAPICYRCGMPLGTGLTTARHKPGCRAASEKELQIDGFVACGFYEGVLRQAILTFKYDGLQTLASPLGGLMAAAWTRLSPANLPLDGIIPVPLHPARQRHRGFCQATLLARELATELHVPLLEGSLIRTKHTMPQVGLSARERQANVRDAFRCTNTALSGKRILVVDDVVTTGSTLGSACAALRQAGSPSAWALTVALARS